MKYIYHRKGFKSYKASVTIIKPNHTARTEYLENAQIFESIIQYPIYLWEVF